MSVSPYQLSTSCNIPFIAASYCSFVQPHLSLGGLFSATTLK